MIVLAPLHKVFKFIQNYYCFKILALDTMDYEYFLPSVWALFIIPGPSTARKGLRNIVYKYLFNKYLQNKWTDEIYVKKYLD